MRCDLRQYESGEKEHRREQRIPSDSDLLTKVQAINAQLIRRVVLMQSDPFELLLAVQ